MSEMVIADVSKAFPNTLPQTADAVREYCSANGIAPASITLVARPDQVSAQPQFPPPSTWVFASSANDAVSLNHAASTAILGPWRRRNVALV